MLHVGQLGRDLVISFLGLFVVKLEINLVLLDVLTPALIHGRLRRCPVHVLFTCGLHNLLREQVALSRPSCCPTSLRCLGLLGEPLPIHRLCSVENPLVGALKVSARRSIHDESLQLAIFVAWFLNNMVVLEAMGLPQLQLLNLIELIFCLLDIDDAEAGRRIAAINFFIVLVVDL